MPAIYVLVMLTMKRVVWVSISMHACGSVPILYLHNPIIHLFYAPKNCIGTVLDFSWDIFMSQEKLQTMIMQNLGR